jgi:hypothetical protein
VHQRSFINNCSEILLSSGANILFKKVGYLVTSAVIALPRMKKHFNEKRFNHTAASYKKTQSQAKQ